jgi:hypothetical protein
MTPAYGLSYGWRRLGGQAAGSTRRTRSSRSRTERQLSPPKKAENGKQKTKAMAPKKKAEVKAEAGTAAKPKPAQKYQAPEASMGVGPLYGGVTPRPLPRCPRWGTNADSPCPGLGQACRVGLLLFCLLAHRLLCHFRVINRFLTHGLESKTRDPLANQSAKLTEPKVRHFQSLLLNSNR